MSEAFSPPGARGATIMQFPLDKHEQARDKPVALASTLELYCKTFPSQHALLTLLQSWLFAAEAEGVAARQPEYAAALKRAIKALSVAHSVPEGIAMLRATETALLLHLPRRPE